MPSAMNRACQVPTTGFDLPDRRMISAVPRVQLRESRMRLPNPFAQMRLTTSAFVIHMNGLTTSNGR
jgi:hypothetical protein